MSPDARKSEILQAARRLLARGGLAGFSLESVAREASVALSLPRHYFGGTDDLLKAVTEDVLREVEDALLNAEDGASDASRYDAYLQILARSPWGHEVWMRAADLHPDLETMVQKARRRMIEASYRRPWSALTELERLNGRGFIGYFEAVVTEWIAQGMKNREVVVLALIHANKLSATATTVAVA